MVKIGGEEVQCMHTIRNTANPKEHQCFATIKDQSGEEKGGIDIKKLVSEFIGRSNLGLAIVEESFFQDFIKTLIQYGQIKAHSDIDELMPHMNRQNIREQMISVAKDRFLDLMALAHKEPSMCLTIDSGTLSKKRLIDFCLISPSFKPIFFKAVENSCSTTNDYKNITEEVLNEIFSVHHVKVIAIVSDNLPIQINALAHWSPSSLLNTSNDERIKKITLFLIPMSHLRTHCR